MNNLAVISQLALTANHVTKIYYLKLLLAVFEKMICDRLLLKFHCKSYESYSQDLKTWFEGHVISSAVELINHD